MKSTFVSDASTQSLGKWTRSEWFGMPGRSERPSPTEQQTAPELECLPDKLVQNLNFRDTLSGQDTLGGKIRAKRVA